MTPEQYISNILTRITADTSATSPALGVRNALLPTLTHWGSGYLNSVTPSGSFARGTAITNGTDIDLFVSMTANTPGSLEDLYNNLATRLSAEGYSPRAQNVSLNIQVDGFSVDLVPARLQDQGGLDHSLFRRRAGYWTKTNVAKHISTVQSGGRQRSTRLIKHCGTSTACTFRRDRAPVCRYVTSN
jgi:tRNA nucleotidyltransferase (CCA-adding enzyme)